MSAAAVSRNRSGYFEDEDDNAAAPAAFKYLSCELGVADEKWSVANAGPKDASSQLSDSGVEAVRQARPSVASPCRLGEKVAGNQEVVKTESQLIA